MAGNGVGSISHDQRGISLFEILIILLIGTLIAISCIVTIRKITSNDASRYDTYEGVQKYSE